MTMNPAPSPGNHGATRRRRCSRSRPTTQPATPPGSPARSAVRGSSRSRRRSCSPRRSPARPAPPGPNCPTAFTRTNPADDVYGVWSGRRSREHGTPGPRSSGTPSASTSPRAGAASPTSTPIPQCWGATSSHQIDARVPFTRGDLTADAAPSSTILEGAVLRSVGGLPLGTGLDLSTDDFDVVPGGTSRVRVALTAPRRGLTGARAYVDLPAGWSAGRDVLQFGDVRPGRTKVRTVAITAPDDAATGARALVRVDVRAADRHRYRHPAAGRRARGLRHAAAAAPGRDLPPWAEASGVEQLTGTVKPVLTLPSRRVAHRRRRRDQQRRLGPQRRGHARPARRLRGRRGEPAVRRPRTRRDHAGLVRGHQHRRRPCRRPTRAAPPATTTTRSRTTTADATAQSGAALELVPDVELADTEAPTLDGEIEPGEYAAEVDLSRLWEGTACETPPTARRHRPHHPQR